MRDITALFCILATHSSERVAASKNPRARSIVVSVFAIELVIVNFGLNTKMTPCYLYLTICHKNVARYVAIMSQDLS